MLILKSSTTYLYLLPEELTTKQSTKTVAKKNRDFKRNKPGKGRV